MGNSVVSGMNPDANKRSAAPAPTSKLSQVLPVQSQAATRYQLVQGKKPVSGSSAAVARPVAAPKVADSKALPGRTVSAASAKVAPVAQPTSQVAQAQKPAKAPEPIKAAALAPAKPAQTELVRPAAPAKEPEATGTLPSSPSSAEFRWPARGRVISGFGGSGSNEGINIAVPEGTPVKAAEAGTVAYAGSEVKGYGNLVLIRHENGFVSAYAHNGEIEVKRGQKVTRGQVVAKSGQTGNVTSPQLHFEIRKGSTPVDPMPHLAGN
jgi:murein DD-endopeptidase MepM/ murein hydrolase activator NlpD